jgi:N-glycosylase/DNA lyase
VPAVDSGETSIVSLASARDLDWRVLWHSVGSRYEERARVIRAHGEAAFKDELIFCLLSGHAVPYELARSAAEVVLSVQPLDEHWCADGLRDRLAAELEQPQFEPRRRDGSLRRYRFPQRKAALVAEACVWVRDRDPLWERLVSLRCEGERRDFLCGCPGTGLKTASFLLRNCGLADQLAILDVHVVRLMRLAGRVGNVRLPRDYATAEREYLRWCAELDASPAAFDLLLWELGRGVLAAQ